MRATITLLSNEVVGKLNHINNLRDQGIQRFFIPFFPKWITPNRLSSLRILCSPIILYLLWANIHLVLAKIIFIFVALTDIFDGPLARARKQHSKIGGLLDGISDKVLICPLVFILLRDYDNWLIFFVCLNDFISLLLAIFAFKNKLEVKANILGKYKMVAQSMAIFFIILWPSSATMVIKILWFALGLGVGSVILHCHNYLQMKKDWVPQK